MLVDTIVGVPVDCSGRFAGCERMPAALRAAGLADWPVRDLGNLQVTLADPTRDPVTGILAYRDLVNASAVIRSAIGGLLRDGRRPLVVGGCCSLLIGTAAGVQDVHPGAGLAFLDGHHDFYTGATSLTGEAADMELAILLGTGPAELTGLTARSQIQRPDEVVVIGPRDAAAAAVDGAADPASVHPQLRVHDADEICHRGPAAVAADALAALTGPSRPAGRFWVHVDLDVLSDEAFPAVDYPQPGGLSWDDLTGLVAPLVTDPGFLGLDVTILNPTKDPDGEAAAAAVRWLSDVLA